MTNQKAERLKRDFVAAGVPGPAWLAKAKLSAVSETELKSAGYDPDGFVPETQEQEDKVMALFEIELRKRGIVVEKEIPWALVESWSEDS